MKKDPIQKAEEYLQKAKDILGNTPVLDVLEDGTLLHYTDVKNIKRAGRTAWKGCSIALNYALEASIQTYDYRSYEERTRQIDMRFRDVFENAWNMLVYYMKLKGWQQKVMCDEAIREAELLVKMCKNMQNIVEQHEEEKRKDWEESMRKDKEDKRQYKRIIKQQSNELLELLLEKTGTSRRELIRAAYEDFVASNLDVLTDEEVKHFDHLVI